MSKWWDEHWKIKNTNLNLKVLINFFFIKPIFYEKVIPSLIYLPCRNEGILYSFWEYWNLDKFTNIFLFIRTYSVIFCSMYSIFCFLFISNKYYFQITYLGMRHVKSCIIILNSKSIIYLQYLNWSLLKLLRNIKCSHECQYINT